MQDKNQLNTSLNQGTMSMGKCVCFHQQLKMYRPPLILLFITILEDDLQLKE